ncbi:MAG TPA: hypothetical protein VLX44_19790 [Xanthobacteraceae bacterium]|nr:hypothetical protein [Xanthobacteraceae bacterium]
MSERGWMCVLRACVMGAAAAACAMAAGAAPATEGCTPKPAGPAPQGQHWYYVLDRVAKRQCWHLGALGVAAQRSATLRGRHRIAPARETAAAAATESHAAVTEPAASETTAPPAPVAQIMDPSPPREAAAPDMRPTRPADAIAPAPAPASKPAEAPATLARSTAAAPDGADHSFALIVLAAALLMIVGPVLAVLRWWSGRKARVERAAVPAWHAAPVVVRVPATRRPPLAPDQPAEDIGESLRRLLDEALPKEYRRASTPAAT